MARRRVEVKTRRGWSTNENGDTTTTILFRELDVQMARFLSLGDNGVVGGDTYQLRRGMIRGLARALSLLIDGANVRTIEQESKRRVTNDVG